MSKRHVITEGARFGKLEIIREYSTLDGSGKKRRCFEVKCDCGVLTSRMLKSLVSGDSTHCGCLGRVEKNVDYTVIGETAKGGPVIAVKPFNEEVALIGQKYGRWTIVAVGFRTGKTRMVEAHCDCGTVRIVRKTRLVNGGSASCGCENVEKFVERNKLPEGTIRGRAYKSWHSMLQRTGNPKSLDYHNYGGRGILVCDEWIDSFDQFLEDMGECPDGLTIERIDVNEGYFKDNCKWATANEQNWNRRTPITNTSGRVGVSYLESIGKWKANIGHMGASYNLGTFSTFEGAVKAREEAELKYYGALKEI